MYNINTTKGYFLHLASCAISGTAPVEKPAEVSFADVYELAKKHSAANLIWYAIEKLQTKPSGDVLSKWQTSYGMYLNNTAYQDMELEILADIFSSNNYDYMPLKGAQIKTYYPEPDMRSMGDIDLLVRTDKSQSARDKVKDLMVSNGYEIDVLNDGQVDAYKNANGIEIEIHFEFSHINHAFYEHFIVDWDRLIKLDEHRYEMTLEDLYYFNIGHFAKNMFTKGIGFKTILDTYVLWNKLSEEEKQSITSRLAKIELDTFNNTLVELSKVWFDNEVDEGLFQIGEYILDNGVYGTEKHRAIVDVMGEESKGNSNGKSSFLLMRIFPPAYILYNRFNIKHKNPILLPFLWLIRIISLLFSSKEKKDMIRFEKSKIESVTKEDVQNSKQIFDTFGINYVKYFPEKDK